MENTIILSISVTVVYVCIKVLEMKWIDKKWKPIKDLVRDAFIVLFCTLITTVSYQYIEPTLNELFNVVTETNVVAPSNTQIFTDEPGF